MVSKTQLWPLVFIKKKYLWKSDICILLWKYFSRQIYLYNFYIYKLNNLKVIDDLYSQCLIQTLSKTTFKSDTEGVYRERARARFSYSHYEYTQRGEPSRSNLANEPVLVELTGLNTIQLYLSMRAYLQEFKNWGVNQGMLRGACVAVVAFLKICTYVYPVL
jgi:hypothetical protein